LIIVIHPFLNELTNRAERGMLSFILR